jgi:hypothetical protein
MDEPDSFLVNLEKLRLLLIEQGTTYRRGHQLVVSDRSVMMKTRYGDRPHLAVHGLDQTGLLRRLHEIAAFFRTDSFGMLQPCHPSRELRGALLDYFGDESMGLPILRGVMCCPFLRPDGSVCATPGYDATTGIFFDPGADQFPAMPDIPEDNAKELAELALLRLMRPMRGYRFDTSTKNDDGSWNPDHDTSRAVALSMFLTAVAVHATRTRPGYLADAPTFGSGKTMLTELPPMMATGIDPVLLVMPDKERGGTEELDKQLDSALLASAGYVIFDNVRGDLERFVRLAALLTAARLGVRIFHTQTLVPIDNNFLVQINGNNCSASADMARRLLRSRIDTQQENPDQLAFDFDPRAEVLRDRGQMCIDALTILRAYTVAGRPKQNGRAYGSFEEWTGLVRDSLLWLGLPDIVASNDEERAADPALDELQAFMDAWKAAGLVGRYTAQELVAKVPPSLLEYDSHWPLRQAMLAVARDIKGNTISDRRLGRWLTQVKDRRLDGRFIKRSFLDGKNRYELREPYQQTSLDV